GMVHSGLGVAGLSPSGIGLNHIVVDTLGMYALSVTSRSETCHSSCNLRIVQNVLIRYQIWASKS
ncbi:hypothetical protein Tco_0342247, partial [Tanacetum coccineum]